MNKLIIFALLFSIQAQSKGLGDYLRDADGTIKTRIDHNQALELCCMENGMSKDSCEKLNWKAKDKLKVHLPTARELALEATKHGAEMLELSQVSSGETPKGFKLVIAVNPDGKKDHFYYSQDHYAKPAGDLGNYQIWSSSVPPVHDEWALVFIDDFGWGSDNGVISVGLRDIRSPNGAVRCIDSTDVNR